MPNTADRNYVSITASSDCNLSHYSRQDGLFSYLIVSHNHAIQQLHRAFLALSIVSVTNVSRCFGWQHSDLPSNRTTLYLVIVQKPWLHSTVFLLKNISVFSPWNVSDDSQFSVARARAPVLLIAAGGPLTLNQGCYHWHIFSASCNQVGFKTWIQSYSSTKRIQNPPRNFRSCISE